MVEKRLQALVTEVSARPGGPKLRKEDVSQLLAVGDLATEHA